MNKGENILILGLITGVGIILFKAAGLISSLNPLNWQIFKGPNVAAATQQAGTAVAVASPAGAGGSGAAAIFGTGPAYQLGSQLTSGAVTDDGSNIGIGGSMAAAAVGDVASA